MKRILLYSHPNEPVTRTILTMPNIYPVSISKFLTEASVFDEIDTYGQKVKWTFTDGITLQNDCNHYLINRLFEIPKHEVTHFIQADQLYAQSELKAYFTFAIAAFPVVSIKPGPFGLCGNHFSLPRQWEMVNNAVNGLKTPEYFLGNLSELYDLPRLVCSDPFRYYYWRPTVTDSSFAFIKPDGEPVISCAIGDTISIYSYRSEFNIDDILKKRIQEIVCQLASIFSLDILEALFFVNDTTVTFGMISNIPLYSCQKPNFDKMIQDYYLRTPTLNAAQKFGTYEN